MVAGTIRLGAFGKEELYLSYRPQITFFKNVYKRHTFFAQETIDQSFSSTPNFGGKFSCIISAHGDLLLDVILRIKLPAIPVLPSGMLSRWTECTGCALIKKVEFEINGSVIDTLTGEWIRIYLELMGHKKRHETRGSHHRGLMKMMGGSFDNNPPVFNEMMDTRTLYVPLPFWFTRSYGQCFPIASVSSREVRINVELNPLASVLQYGPTHYIEVLEDDVFFKVGDLLFQKVYNDDRNTDAEAFGLFIKFNQGRVYYNPILGSFTQTSSIPSQERLLSPRRYMIRNKGGLFCTPSSSPMTVESSDLDWLLSRRFSLGESAIMCHYAFLGSMEKKLFDSRRHEYVLEQLQVFSLTDLSRKNNVQLVIRRPCSELVWVAQLLGSNLFGLPFNYTDLPDGSGVPLILSQEVLLNTESVFADPTGNFFRDVQLFSYHVPCGNRIPGIQVYSFANFPDDPQPSGSINMSKIEKAYLQFQTSSFPRDSITMRVFARTYNVLVIQNGIAELLF